MLYESKMVGQIASELFHIAEGVETLSTAKGHNQYLGNLLGKRLATLASALIEHGQAHRTKKDDT